MKVEITSPPLRNSIIGFMMLGAVGFMVTGCQGGSFVDATQQCQPGTPPVCNNETSRLLCLDGALKLEICGQVTCEGLEAQCVEGSAGAVCECGLVPPPCSDTVCHAPAACGEQGCECTSTESVCKDGGDGIRAHCQDGALTYETCADGVADQCESEWDLRVCVEANPGQAECVCRPCEPNCAGRECGPDGCGGRCEDNALAAGSCEAEYGERFSCGEEEGQCLCQPDCQGRECGPDGCGGEGLCGICKVEEGYTCTDLGTCQDPCQGVACGSVPLPVGCGLPGADPCTVCPDSCVDLEWKACDESINQCVPYDPCQNKEPPWECGPHPSGTGECGPGCTSCLTACDEDTHQCVPEDPCADSGWVCGWQDCPNGQGQVSCGDLGGLCPSGSYCSNGTCISNCPSDETPCGDQCCAAGSTCDPNPPTPGKDACCWPQAGFVCLPTGESCVVDSCGNVSDCSACLNGDDGYCDPGSGQCVVCADVCADKECGSGVVSGECPCGALSGECAPGLACQLGACVCPADCDGKSCGDDGCGGICGQCLGNEYCSADGQCICDTETACQDKECGVSGCPGVMCPNLCAPGFSCQGNTCIDSTCDTKECGPDGYGGWCGDCPSYTHCEEGSCVPNVCGDGVCEPSVYGSNGWAYLGEACSPVVAAGVVQCPQDCGGFECHPTVKLACGCINSAGVQNGFMVCTNTCHWGPCQEPECCSDADCSGACEVCQADGTCGLAATAECVAGASRKCPGGKSCEFQFCEEGTCSWGPCSSHECCGEADTDGDGVGDALDAFPNDPDEHSDGDQDGIGDVADTDDDNDGTPDDEDTDDDDDGVVDTADLFPTDPSESSDTDGDGVGDVADVYPDDPLKSTDVDPNYECHSNPAFGVCHSCVDKECVYSGHCVPGSIQDCDDEGKPCGTQVCDELCGWGECSAPECCEVSDCPEDPGECLLPYCTDGTCTVFTEPDNTVCGPSPLNWCEAGECICHPDCVVAAKGCGDNGCGDPVGCGICDDGDICTSDACVDFQCAFTDIPAPTCCHTDEQCQPHKDNNCFIPSCVANVCEFTEIEGCVPCAVDGDCDDAAYNPDNYPCTLDICQEDETCTWEVQEACVPCWDVTDCDDGRACTLDICQEDETCAHSPVEGCVPCDLPAECDVGPECQEPTCILHACGLADLAAGTSCDEGCGACASGICEDLVCAGGCPVCTACVCGQCVATDEGQACDESRPNALCEDGACACESTCGGLCGGAADGCAGTCDDGCPAGEACEGTECVCVPDCQKKCSGEDNGCGQPCPFTTCYDGCCDSGGVCRTDGALEACGNAGGDCKECAGEGASCVGGQCFVTQVSQQTFDAAHDTYVTEITPEVNHDGEALTIGAKGAAHHVALIRFPDLIGSLPVPLAEMLSAQICFAVNDAPPETMAVVLRDVAGCTVWDESALTWEAFSADCSTGDVLQTVLVGPPSETVCFDIQGEVTLSLTALAETGLMVEPLGGVDPSEVETISFHSTESGAGPQLIVTYEETSVSQCKENWVWTEWSLCDCAGQQQRTGTEQNGCAATPVVTEMLPCEANPCPACSLCDDGACVPEPAGLPCGTCSACDGAGACTLVLDGTSCDGEQDLVCAAGECVCPQNPSSPTPEDAYEPNGSASCADCLGSDDQETVCADLPDDESLQGGSWISCESLMGSWTKGSCQGSCDWKAGPGGEGLETACVLGAAGGSGGYTAQCAPEAAPEDLDVCQRTVFGTEDGVGPVTLAGVLGGDDTVDHYGFLVQEDPAAELDPVVTLTGIPEGADYQLCVGWSPGATPGEVNVCGWPTSWPDTATMSGGDELAPVTCQVGSEEAPSGVLDDGLRWCCSDNPGNASEYVAIGGEGLAWGADGHGNLMVRVVQSASGCWLQGYELEVQHF